MKKFECKNCGAELYWDSNANCLKCEYCDAEYQPSDFNEEGTDVEGADTEATSATGDASPKKTEPEKADEYAKATDDSDSIELVVYKCEHCGAEIVTAKSTIATTCAYCGRAISITDKLVDNFKPDAVIPFLFDETKAKEAYKKYIHSSCLTPKDFSQESVIKKMKGVYVPFWLHSFEHNTDATVYGENVMSSRRGDDKIIDHHMYHISIDASGTFTNIPTDALRNLDNALMDALEPFDYSKLEEFNPAYMAGFYAEEYNEDEDATLSRATERAKQTMMSRVESAAGTYGIKYIKSSSERIVDRKSRYAMLPVWLLNVEYHDKDYLFAINGETGKIVGKLPVSVGKLLAIVAGTFAGSYVLITLVKMLMLIGGAL